MANPNPEKADQLPADGFPPPPPGPPPAQQQYATPHPNPLATNPVEAHPEAFYAQQAPHDPAYPPPPQEQAPLYQHQESHGAQPVDQHQQAYAVPPYDPAHPTFAPPPADEKPSTGPVPDAAPAVLAEEHAHAHAGGLPNTAPAAGAPAEGSGAAGHKKGWGERFSKLGSLAANPINSLAHKLGSQSFLPESLDKECDKAALILKAFCKNGVYADPAAGQPPTSTDPQAAESSGGMIDPTKEKPRDRVMVTIPPRVISKALGLAIFTTLRAGFQVSGATGSGILVARLPDGSWGPPSGIQVHSVGGGFQIGLDIYDCVCVINSKEALAAFMDTRVSLGSDLAVVAGPYGAGGAVDFGSTVEKGKGKDKQTDTAAPADPSPTAPAPAPAEETQTLKPADQKTHRRSLSASRLNPVFSYVKSRGFYAGVRVDGTVVVERKDANAAFYGDRVGVAQILGGQVPAQGPPRMWPAGARGLHEVLRGAEAGVLQGEAVAGAAPAVGAAPAAPAGGPVPVTPAGGSVPATASGAVPGPTASGAIPADTEQAPPAYVDDGVPRSGVGDVKYS